MKIQIPENSELKILRLGQGSRYVVALQTKDEVIAKPFWTEAQALTSENVPISEWVKVTTEVFAAIHVDDTPPDVQLFAKSTRRGRVHGVVVWSRSGIHPKILPNLAEAVAVTRASCRKPTLG
ncbi:MULTISPECIES: hypothetical protein [Rhizobium/Agrobacterium group]|uniref:hypothetical protein n=1 Tax=Rhizobium/Agrobacterium group TaxID=227290 RepID=UPI001ADC7DD1|nr:MULTISPECIES: hypothetical protein [Rhizobium/Agrobacterium group]MBO9112728.1 hypothetical protein [Agrobacterium sp. S2/73]QXZ76214.1 hypothetical protein J5276_24930 [Agrobacterium sp. S7/73]QYA17238.1 hypothetical protein J5284_31785 [Rhizobium sp. AB2/73]